LLLPPFSTSFILELSFSHKFPRPLLAALLLSACARRAPPPPPSEPHGPQVLRLSQRNEPADLDPALASLPDDFFVIRALSEGLVVPTGAGAPQPALAESWEVSPDQLTWTFHLRPNASWSNGDPVTADDLLASYRRVLTPATAAPKADLFFVVKYARAYATGQLTDFSAVGFLAPDPHTLLVTLERPTPQFLAYAASGPWIPVNPRVVNRLGRLWTRPENFVGNGPFVLAEWRPQQRIVVRKNPLYYGASEIRLDEIQFIHFDDTDTEDRAFRSGQIDATMTVPYSKLDAYIIERPTELRHAPLAETRYLAFNVRRPPLDDLRVRQALSLALDRARLVKDVLRGRQEPAYRLLPPGLRPPGDMASDLSDDALAGTSVAPSSAATVTSAQGKARELLAAAGYPGGRGFPRLELSGWGAGAKPVLEAVQEMWKKELGIAVVLTIREARVHVAALRAGRYDVGYVPLIPDIDDPLAALERFTSQGTENYPHWADAAYDQLVDDALNAPTAEQQATALRAAETRLLDQVPLAPLYFNAKTWLMRPAVQGWEEDALWTRSYLHVYLDPAHE
jgi:oligopeptide transport system substrate-binding protein